LTDPNFILRNSIIHLKDPNFILRNSIIHLKDPNPPLHVVFLISIKHLIHIKPNDEIWSILGFLIQLKLSQQCNVPLFSKKER
jgi:hypothetical protein